MYSRDGIVREHPLGNTPQAQHPLGKIPRSGLAVVAHPHKYSRNNIFRQFNLTVAYFIVVNPENLEIGFCPIVLSPKFLHSRGCDSAKQPAALDLAAFFVFLRSFPPFSLYSSAGDVDGGG